MKYDETNAEGEHFKFFTNVECEYFPCHKGVDPSEYNCLFCFCPAYALGDKCGGNFRYDNEEGIKDCSDCILPHQRDSYGFMTAKSLEIINQIKIK